MTVPAPAPKAASKRAEPAPPVRFAPDEARGQAPVRGDQEQFGSAIAETAAQGFGGLSTGGGSGTRGRIEAADFCCPEYLGVMQQRIQAQWSSRQEVAGTALVKFRILRDGSIVDLELERSSGFYALDYAAQRALLMTKRLPPLPSAYPESSLTVHLVFEYVR
jgi:protein TonB